MTEALLELLPDSPVYHVGMYRNPGSNIPVQYYNRLPKGHPSDVALILDPVIASCEGARHSSTLSTNCHNLLRGLLYIYHVRAKKTNFEWSNRVCFEHGQQGRH